MSQKYIVYAKEIVYYKPIIVEATNKEEAKYLVQCKALEAGIAKRTDEEYEMYVEKYNGDAEVEL